MSAFEYIVKGDEPNWSFETKLEDIATASGASLASRRALIRADSGDVLAIHSDKYRVDTYADVVAAMEDGIVKGGINTDNATCRTSLTHNGGRMFRQYVFPAHRHDIGAEDVFAVAA